MKKWSYIVGGFVLGLVVALSANTAYGAVQSLIGKKVTGEMNVVVNGEKLQDKGAVIEGRTNAPVRALADSLGADLKVDGDTIVITTNQQNNNVVQIDGKYYTQYDLLNKKKSLEDGLDKAKDDKEKLTAEYNSLKDAGKLEGEIVWDARLKSIDDSVASKTTELNKINEALKAFE